MGSCGDPAIHLDSPVSLFSSRTRGRAWRRVLERRVIPGTVHASLNSRDPAGLLLILNSTLWARGSTASDNTICLEDGRKVCSPFDP
ncbi:unnamed protein product [Caretta caretta]